MLSPTTPAPMTTVLGRDGTTIVDAVISDSLRRARPTRFSGSDLSRSGLAAHAVRPSGTPASRQFWLGALRMQGFSQNLARRADAIAAIPSLRPVGKPTRWHPRRRTAQSPAPAALRFPQ